MSSLVRPVELATGGQGQNLKAEDETIGIETVEIGSPKKSTNHTIRKKKKNVGGEV